MVRVGGRGEAAGALVPRGAWGAYHQYYSVVLVIGLADVICRDSATRSEQQVYPPLPATPQPGPPRQALGGCGVGIQKHGHRRHRPGHRQRHSAGGGGGGGIAVGGGGGGGGKTNCEKFAEKFAENCRKNCDIVSNIHIPQGATVLDRWLTFFSVIQKVHGQHNYRRRPSISPWN